MAIRKKKKVLNIVTPEVLPPRPMLKHNRYAKGAEQFSLDTVCIKESIGTTKHLYNAPEGDGVVARRLRRYVLTLSRYEIPNQARHAKRWGFMPTTLDSASRIVANCLHKHAYGDDPSTDTTNTKGLADSLSQDAPTTLAMIKACAYIGTEAFDELLGQITNRDVSKSLKSVRDWVVDTYFHRHDRLTQIRYGINGEYVSDRRYALQSYRYLCEKIERELEETGRDLDRQGEEQQRREPEGRTVRSDSSLCDQWEPLIVSKPLLELNHTGKMGRRTIATNTGRQPHNISRLITDPDKRIFKRKTKALGGVVVVDASGSMSLSQEELQRIMRSSAGCTVIMYSSDSPAREPYPNVWVLARNGRQVRHIPDRPGGNGVDAPALLYSVQFRKHSWTPIVWISDGQVTGKRDSRSAALDADIRRISARHNIVRVENCEEAVRLLTKLQGRSL